MRKIRHLEFCEYVIHLGAKVPRPVLLCDNVVLERTWHNQQKSGTKLNIHAVFNSVQMSGLRIFAHLEKGIRRLQSSSASCRLFLIDESSWQESLIWTSSSSTSLSTGGHTFDVLQTDLGVNELSGRECYSIEAEVTRKRTKYRAKKYFNHIGIYDHAIQLRQAVEMLEIMKVTD